MEIQKKAFERHFTPVSDVDKNDGRQEILDVSRAGESCYRGQGAQLMNAGVQYRIAPVQSELLTVEQAAEFLNMTKGQIHEMTRARGRERMPIPIPLLRINGNLRFRRSSLEKWLNEIEQYELQQSQPPAA